MTPVAVVGAAGRMGRTVIDLILAGEQGLTLVAAIERDGSSAIGTDAGTLVARSPCGVEVAGLGSTDPLNGAEVVVEFSSPDALRALLSLPSAAAVISGTTGLDEAFEREVQASSTRRAVLRAANFSTGITLLIELTTQAARALPDADIEIVEAHHRDKKDAPSGTALALGVAAARGRSTTLSDLSVHGRSGLSAERPPAEIGFHSIRGGDVVGEHTVWLAQPGERVMLGHVATTRQTFAAGAVRAAAWIADRPPGWYTMRDVLGLDSAGGAR